VDASSDDANEYENTGAVDLTSRDILIINDPDSSARYWGGLRFHNGSFPPQGSLILAAYIEVLTFGDGVNANLDIYAEDAQSPTPFTADAFNITGRTRTSAFVPWVADGLYTGTWWQSPSIVTVIQELVDSYTPTSIVLILKPKTDVYKYLAVGVWDYSGHLFGAKLHLEWVVPTAAGHIKKVSSVDWASVKAIAGLAQASVGAVAGVPAS
jgi:hypothetical protein